MLHHGDRGPGLGVSGWRRRDAGGARGRRFERWHPAVTAYCTSITPRITTAGTRTLLRREDVVGGGMTELNATIGNYDRQSGRINFYRGGSASCPSTQGGQTVNAGPADAATPTFDITWSKGANLFVERHVRVGNGGTSPSFPSTMILTGRFARGRPGDAADWRLFQT